MKKRIFLNTLLACSSITILMATMLSFIFYDFFTSEKSSELRQNTFILAKILQDQQNKPAFLENFAFSPASTRISVVNPAGKVIFDSYKTPDDLDNHLDRPEIIQAKQNGEGQNKRFSNTLGEETYYHAVQLANGDILRLANTTGSIRSIFSLLLPWLFLCVTITIAISLFIARRLTKKIIAPINAIDLDDKNSVAYEELTPLLDRMARQKKQINMQISELEQRANTIQTILKDMHEGIILIDKQGQILSVNPSALAIFQEKQQDFSGQNILELTRNPIITQSIKTALAGRTLNKRLTLDKQTFEIFFDPVKDDQEITGLVILFLDVTDKNAAEKMRREFSANVSHELKTPLTTILGYSEIIENGMAKQEDIKVFAGKIKNQVLNLIKMIESIIKISQLDEAVPDKEFEQFEFVQFANDVIESFTNVAKSYDISLAYIQGKINIKANKTMLQELLTNLLDNAIKYNRPDGKVTVNWQQDKGKLLITVADTGIGIAEEQLPRIFERFYRVDPSRSKKTGGTGLGLSIVKHIVQYHNGEVKVESKLGEGTTINIWLDVLD